MQTNHTRKKKKKNLQNEHVKCMDLIFLNLNMTAKLPWHVLIKYIFPKSSFKILKNNKGLSH